MSEAKPDGRRSDGGKDRSVSAEPTLNLQIKNMSRRAVDAARVSLDRSLVVKDDSAFRKAWRVLMCVLSDPEVNAETRRWLVVRGAQIEQDPTHDVRGVARELAQRILDRNE
jgi:hypothetical protein